MARAGRAVRSPTTPGRWLTRTRCLARSAAHVTCPHASYRQSATDQACLACHDGPIHHADQTFTPSCSSCHVEHQGAFRLASTSDAACTQCHADLKTTHGTSKFASNIRGFDSSHPEFAPLRPGATDPGTIKFNHRVHLKEDLRGPNGPVQLKCADCHQTSGFARSLIHAPVNYEKHCASCHPLQFDRRFSESAPHKDPKVVYDFVFAKLTAYIAAHPAEIPLVDEPDKRLPTRPPQPPARNAAEWVQQRMADAQLLLWRKSCKECHRLSYPEWPQHFAGGREIGDHSALAAAREFRSRSASDGRNARPVTRRRRRAARRPTC